MAAEAQTTNTNDLPTGTVVGSRYRVDGLIGRGGMGEVYAATNTTTGRRVALKLVRSSDVSEQQKRRFLREAKAATAIAHDHVIDVLDVFEEADGTPVMVMELLEGESLASLLSRRKQLSLGEVALLLVPVGRALEAAHVKGIVHRDLKPDNVFLAMRTDGKLVPKVLDFGIAKVLDPEAVVSGTQGGQTQTESILGTPHYMSFEQAMSDKSIDHRTDIWSFGVMVYEALVGERPLKFENLGQMYTLLLQGEVPPIQKALPDLPDAFAALVDRCLKKDRDERLDSLGPLLDALGECDVGDTSIEIATRTSITYISSRDAAATQDAVTATRGDAAPTRLRGWLLAMGIVAVAAAIVTVGLLDDKEVAPDPATQTTPEASSDTAVDTQPQPTSTIAVQITTSTVEPRPSVTPAVPRPLVRPPVPKPAQSVAEGKPPEPAPEPKPKLGISTASPYAPKP